MKFILIIAIIIIGLLLIELKRKEKKNNTEIEIKENKNINFEYFKSKKLLTKNEYKFYMEIRQLCQENNIYICPKVRMEDFVEVKSQGKEYNRYRNMIKSRHVDFIFTDINLNIIAAVELDDNTHNNNKSLKSDEFKNQIYSSIGIPLYRIKTEKNYKEEIKTIINNYNSCK